MGREEVYAFLGGCFNGEPASCTFACPFRADLRAFLKKAARGRWDAAYKELRVAVPFPSVTAALCPAPCEGACQCALTPGGEAVSVRALESAALRFASRREAVSYAIPPRPERLAVVGAGPAGLCCALMLAQKKYQVTVWEREPGWGGALRSHPRFADFDADFRLQFSAVTVEFRFGAAVASREELRDFDAVFIATGRGGEDFGLLPGWNGELGSTAEPRLFLGGELAGLPLMEGMARAARAASSIEAFLQTGSPVYAAQPWDAANARRFAPHAGETPGPAVAPAGEEYTPAEAQAEAGRCMQCDCSACMNACELLETYKKKPPRIANDVNQDGQSRNSVSSAAITRETWSCNLCGRCAASCPAGTDLTGMFQYSRAGRVEGNCYPPALHAYWLREMEFAAGEAALTLPGSGVAFFPGCRLGMSNPAYVTRTYALLREKLGAGLLLNCCGVPAWWAGENAKFRGHLDALRAQWESLGRPKLIVACPSCEKTLAHFLPDMEQVSLYAVLSELTPAAAKPPFPRAAVFDPCAARENGPEKAAVRRLAAALGVECADFDSDGRCCGFGGHMQLANAALYRRIVQNRVSQREEPYLVYCVNCRETFLAAGKPCAHVLDAFFGLESGVPALEEKRENARKVKTELVKEYGGGEFRPERRPWDGLAVETPAEVLEKMERSLIPLGDVRELVWRAERDGTGFQNGRGEVLASLNTGAVSVWARWRAETAADGAARYVLLDVYSHRMQVREEG